MLRNLRVCCGGLQVKAHYYPSFFIKGILMGNILKIMIFLILSSISLAMTIPTIYLNKKPIQKVSHFSTRSVTPITRINLKQNKFLKANNLGTLLQAESGVVVQNLYGNDSNLSFSMRGFGGDANTNTVLLINGQPWINPVIGAYNLSSINIQNISSIEILPGSASVLYGDNAVGGVINIITKPQKKGETASFNFGSFDCRGLSVEKTASLNKNIVYRISTNLKKSDNFRNHNKTQDGNLDTRVDIKHELTHFYIEAKLLRNKLEFPGAITEEQWQQNPKQSTNNTDFNNQNQGFVQAGIKLSISPMWWLLIDGQLQGLKGKGVLSNPFSESLNSAYLHPRFHGLLNVNGKLIDSIFGVSLTHGYYSFNGLTYRSQALLNEQSIYSQFHFPLNKEIKIVYGARYAYAEPEADNPNRFKYHEHAFVSDVGIIWKINNFIKYYLQRAGSYRFPKADENALTQNNQPLSTETGVSYETGFSFHIKRFSAKIRSYLLNLKNEILFVPDVTNNFFGTNQNLPPTKRLGAILSFTYQLTNKIKIAGSYNLVKATFREGIFAGNQIPLVAENSWRLSSIFELSDHWQALLETYYIGQRFPGTDFQNFTKKLPAYQIINTAITYHWKNMSLTFRVNNLANKKYINYATVVYRNNQPLTFVYPTTGRNYMLTLTWNI